MIDDALREELGALLDGTLPQRRAAELRRRLETDPELRREYREMERATAAARSLPRASAPPELRARLRRSIGRPARLVWAAAAAAVILGAGLALRRGGERQVERGGDRRDDRAAKEARPEAPPGLRSALGSRKEGEGKRFQEARGADLVRAVERSRRVVAADRKEYLRELKAMGPEKARAHMLALFGDVGRAEVEQALAARDAGAGSERGAGQRASVLYAFGPVALEDREEAELVIRILGAAREGPAAAVAVDSRVEGQISTHVEGTPEELARLGRWLELVDLARTAAPGPRAVFARAKAKAEEPQREASGEAAAPEEARRLRAIVRLRYGE